MKKGSLLFGAGSVLIMGGAAVLAVYWHDLVDTNSAQKTARRRLDANAAKPAVSRPAATRPAPIRRGDLIGELNIPRLRVSVMVFEGDDGGILKLGAGHIPGTALMPGKGNIGIAAHRDTFFRPLRVIHSGDVITWRTAAGTARFAVAGTEIVPPTDVGVLARAPGRDLTLVTCYPFSFLGHAPRRFIVHAKKIG